jgi:hypothetical protein
MATLWARNRACYGVRTGEAPNEPSRGAECYPYPRRARRLRARAASRAPLIGLTSIGGRGHWRGCGERGKVIDQVDAK